MNPLCVLTEPTISTWKNEYLYRDLLITLSLPLNRDEFKFGLISDGISFGSYNRVGSIEYYGFEHWGCYISAPPHPDRSEGYGHIPIHEDPAACRPSRIIQENDCGGAWQYGAEGDVIGCGYDQVNHLVFFTHNGVRMKPDIRDVRARLYPLVWTYHPHKIQPNFGENQFMWEGYYDLKEKVPQ